MSAAAAGAVTRTAATANIANCKFMRGFLPSPGAPQRGSHATDFESAPPLPERPILSPSRIDLLTDQEIRIHALTRREFLHAAGIDFGNVEISFLIDGKTVHAPEAAREIAPRSPGIEEVPLQIVFQHFRGAAVERPQRAICADIDQVDVRRLNPEAPIVEEFAVFIEHLHAMIP